MTELEEWLEELYSEENLVRELLSLYRKINSLFQSGSFEECDSILKQLELERLSVSLVMGVMSITYPAKDKLPYRSELVQNIKKNLQSRVSPEEYESLMQGRLD